MSRKKNNTEEDTLFDSIPPKEQFIAFPSLDAFADSDIAFLTGKAKTKPAEPRERQTPPQDVSEASYAALVKGVPQKAAAAPSEKTAAPKSSIDAKAGSSQARKGPLPPPSPRETSRTSSSAPAVSSLTKPEETSARTHFSSSDNAGNAGNAGETDAGAAGLRGKRKAGTQTAASRAFSVDAAPVGSSMAANPAPAPSSFETPAGQDAFAAKPHGSASPEAPASPETPQAPEAAAAPAGRAAQSPPGTVKADQTIRAGAAAKRTPLMTPDTTDASFAPTRSARDAASSADPSSPPAPAAPFAEPVTASQPAAMAAPLAQERAVPGDGASDDRFSQESLRAEPVAGSDDRPDMRPDSRPHSQPGFRPQDQSEGRSDGQSQGRPVNPSYRISDTRPDREPVGESVSLSAGHEATRSATLKADHTYDQTINLSQSHTFSQPLTTFVTHSASPSQNPTTSLTLSQSFGRFTVGDRLNENQRRVLAHLLAIKPYIIKFRAVGDALGICEASIRTILRRLSALGFLSFKKARDGAIQGISITFNQNLCEQFLQDLTLSPSQNLSPSLTQSQPDNKPVSLTASLSENLTQSHAFSEPLSKPIRQPDSKPDDLKIERKENLSIQNPIYPDWDDPFMRMMWPAAYEAGFRAEQVRQVVDARRKAGKEADLERMSLSLDRADWELETKGGLIDVQTGDRIRNPAGYIFTAMARWGVLRAHPEYVSREEEEAAAALAEIRRRREAASQLEDALFQAWLDGLSPSERRDIVSQSPGGPEEKWLKNYWRKRK